MSHKERSDNSEDDPRIEEHDKVKELNRGSERETELWREQPGASSQERRRKDGREQPGASSLGKPERQPEEFDGAAEWLEAINAEEDAAGGGEKLPPPSEKEDEFEVRKHKVARRPALPTKAEIEEHVPLHLHYRSWCRHRVSGKARSNQHMNKDNDEERLGVTWNADYAFYGW